MYVHTCLVLFCIVLHYTACYVIQANALPLAYIPGLAIGINKIPGKLRCFNILRILCGWGETALP